MHRDGLDVQLLAGPQHAQRLYRLGDVMHPQDRRPALRGRTALYGPRHLAQVVTIKRWQSEGRTLAEIQRQLAERQPEPQPPAPEPDPNVALLTPAD